MAQAKRGLGKGLGRGLGALFGEDVVEEVVHEKEAARGEQAEKASAKALVKPTRKKSDVSRETSGKTSEKQEDSGREEKKESAEVQVRLTKIEPNKDQPRKTFNEEQLKQLAESMKHYGVLQPLLVQREGEGYKIVAGERRWRAAKMAGLKEVPVVIREYEPRQAMEIALIENVQRENLNPIEEARAYQQLIQEFDLKQEEIAERVAKSRTTITNSLRLLNLAEEVQQMLVNNQITSGHARALLSLENPKDQMELAQKIEQNKMSVREVEKAVKLIGKEKTPKKEKETDEALELVFRDLEERMKTVMGTKVNISRKDKSKGKIEIEYYSESELERIVELIESIR